MSFSILAAIKIMFIDLVLSGDNAVVIAMASRSLPHEQQKKAVFWGGAAAIALRVAVTALVAVALAIPLLQLAGGLMLFYIACKLLKGEDESKEVRAGSTLWNAITTIVVADFVMSLDNMLAVGGASEGHVGLLLGGLVFSMAIIMFASTKIADLMNRFSWLVYAGAGILAWTAGEMILHDRWLHKVYEPGPAMRFALPLLLVTVTLLFGYVSNRREAA